MQIQKHTGQSKKQRDRQTGRQRGRTEEGILSPLSLSLLLLFWGGWGLSQFIEKGFKKTERFEHTGVLLFLFLSLTRNTMILEDRNPGSKRNVQNYIPTFTRLTRGNLYICVESQKRELISDFCR